MQPKVVFIWSPVYQEIVHSHHVKSERYNDVRYEKYVKAFIQKLKTKWRYKENDILSSIANILDLSWRKQEIECYVIKISTFLPFSYPLTIPIQWKNNENVYTLSVDRYIDMLIHELIHVFFIQCSAKVDPYFNYILNKKYQRETPNVALHVPVHAIQKKILLKLFGKEHFLREIRNSSFHSDYKRSWEIVESEGEDTIIQELKHWML